MGPAPTAAAGEAGGAGFHAERYELDAFDAEVASAWAPLDLAAEVERLTDPAQAAETLHWGRNYLYALQVETVAGPLEVVVKQFRHQGLVARLRRRLSGSKARKSWRAAGRLVEAGVPTADPVLLLESKSGEGASFFVSRRLQDVIESRYVFRALAAGTHGELFPDIDRAGLMRALGALCRALHDAGAWHRDISIGNLLVRPSIRDPEPEVFVLDLNRARLDRRLGLIRRTRDLCRLPLVSAGDREIFLSRYWGGPVGRASLRYLLLAVFARTFVLRNRAKEAARRPFRAVERLVRGRRAYTHIPSAPAGAEARDKAVWDHLSDQPHQHASRVERARVRLGDAGAHAGSVTATLAAAPRIWRRYRRLRRQAFSKPVAWPGAGIALRPHPEDPDGLLEALAATGVRRVLLRLHPWQSDHRQERLLAQELAERGYEIVFALPQNRDLVRDPKSWRGAVEELVETFRPFGRHFQVGQAINRSKWGVWTQREYLDLVAAASEILRRTPETLILGPAVIDFEPYATAAAVNMPREDVYFDVLSSLLYVDRRGAPENRQLGFDSVGKATLLRAIAETSRSSGPQSWITEANWPLWEGPHAPAGRDVAVSEETQADYLVRYYLLLLASGMASRVYWWQLVARGYGLVVAEADGRLRRRPSHAALSTLESELGDTTFEERMPAGPGVFMLRFRSLEREDRLVAWSTRGPTSIELPRPARSTLSRDGERLTGVTGLRADVEASPRYFHLEAASA